MKHRSDIEGLRALAVLPVILFHAGIGLFSGGYVGVDVFFVISGYVIAKSLEGDLRSGDYSLANFYYKRIRRIFPALFATVLATLLLGFVLLLPEFLAGLFKSVAAAAVFASNIFFWKDSGYFAATAVTRPLLHTWSLSVEEQYYIFAPVWTMLVYRYFGRRWVLCFLPVIIASLALSIYATTTAPTANFYLLPTRAWELLLGALLAHAAPQKAPARAVAELAGLAGLGMIVFAVFSYSDTTAFPGLSAVLPCLGAALIIHSGTSGATLAGRLLSLPFMGFTGKISYSLYLIHWPLFVFAYMIFLRHPTVLEAAGIIALTFALAFLSWKYVETPFRRPSDTLTRRRVLAGGSVTIILFLFIGLGGMLARGFPQRFPDFVKAEPANTPEQQDVWGNGSCFLEGVHDPALWSAAKCTITPEGRPKALLWGDSFAAHYTPGIKRLAAHIPYTILQYTGAGCPPVLSYVSHARPLCHSFNEYALQIIREQDIRVVVLAGKWTDMRSRGVSEIRSTVAALTGMGVQVYLIGQSPEYAVPIEMIAYRKGNPQAVGADSWYVSFPPGINDELKVSAPGATFIDPLQALCEGNKCPYRVDGVPLYMDEGHYSFTGSEMAVQRYFPLYR